MNLMVVHVAFVMKVLASTSVFQSADLSNQILVGPQILDRMAWKLFCLESDSYSQPSENQQSFLCLKKHFVCNLVPVLGARVSCLRYYDVLCPKMS